VRDDERTKEGGHQRQQRRRDHRHHGQDCIHSGRFFDSIESLDHLEALADFLGLSSVVALGDSWPVVARLSRHRQMRQVHTREQLADWPRDDAGGA